MFSAEQSCYATPVQNQSESNPPCGTTAVLGKQDIHSNTNWKIREALTNQSIEAKLSKNTCFYQRCHCTRQTHVFLGSSCWTSFMKNNLPVFLEYHTLSTSLTPFSFLILQILLSLLLYKHIQTMSRFILGSDPNSKNIPSNTSDFSFYLILLLIFFLISCAFCIIEIIALPTAAILDGELTASFLSLLLNLGPDLCMKIFPVGTFDV